MLQWVHKAHPSLSFRRAKSPGRQTWKPFVLRAPVLLITVAICWALIAVLQFFLTKSQRYNGVIFAPKINDLPLTKTFIYLYFPTIVAVLFSIFWTWIDLETKRMEPYYQLSKENGALGADSLLLHYPFDFIPLVPLKAFRDRHWPVFWASCAVVLVTFGLVPTQAGIFSTKTILQTSSTSFQRAASFSPASNQSLGTDLRFAQSTYGIAVLNETLPTFMARNYTLAPFLPPSQAQLASYGNWTAQTTMYSVDLWCEPATISTAGETWPGHLAANSSNGCSFTYGLTGNLTVGAKKEKGHMWTVKEFTVMYTGYSNPNGFAQYDLTRACPETSNNTFYAAIARSKNKDTDPPNNVNAIYCRPLYYQQQVLATIDAGNWRPLAVKSVGEKEALPDEIFNKTRFEELLGAGSLGLYSSDDSLPGSSTPDYLDFVARTNVSMGSGASAVAPVDPMAGLALAINTRPLDDLLEWQVLAKTYADAYRLIFSRAIKEILSADDTTHSTEQVKGEVRFSTEAVILEPVFVYIVEGLLGVVSISTLALLYLSVTRVRALRSNPSTIAAVMSLVADNESLLSNMEGFDCCTLDEIKTHIGQKRYKLVGDEHSVGIVELISDDQTHLSQSQLGPRQNTSSTIAKPVRPIEFSFGMAVPFVSLFVGLAICLAVLFAKAHGQGLKIPSSNTFVQNILENYIPTAIATLIEPLWILINRLLCMLQPIQELQSCNARAKNSIDLDYSSLPPQLMIWKALRSRHFVLAAVCSMALLANLLAIAFSGIFNQATIDMRYPISFQSPHQLKFVPIDGTTGPIGTSRLGTVNTSGAYLGGSGIEPFLVAESYFREGTPLPAWTDENLFYLPLLGSQLKQINETRYEARTKAFGARLECHNLAFDNSFQAALVQEANYIDTYTPIINITLPDSKFQCTSRGGRTNGRDNSGNPTCLSGPSAMEFVFQPGAKDNATQAEVDACMGSIVLGWVRDRNGTCGKNLTTIRFNDQNSAFVHCRPTLLTGSALIQVDSNGHLQGKAQEMNLERVLSDSYQDLFSNNAVNVVGQSNRYIFLKEQPYWHSNAFAVDYINYFTMKAANTTRLVDPAKGPPSFEDIEKSVNKAYSLLFAIWMGIYKNQLLIPYDATTAPIVEGYTIMQEKRLFLSTPMFVISETILGCYIIAACMVYIRRPGQYLPRMPTSIASIIALFAASAAVLDMRNTSQLDRKGRAQHLSKTDARYGYGSFVGGGDGRVHIGIEKSPFVRKRAKTTWLEKKVTSFRKTPSN